MNVGDHRITGGDEPLVQVQEIVKHFPVGRGLFGRGLGAVRAVNGVSLEIGRGETLALVGESGCGKTTLGRLILRLLDPTSGTIRFAGTDIHSLEGEGLAQLRRSAQIVFQDPFASLNPRLTVGSTLREILHVHGLAHGKAAERRCAELLDAVGLRPEDASKYAHEFSGGQRQRIGIARALAVEPEFIVADEPVSALDVSVQAQVLNLLADLQERFALTYLLISHDLSVVRHIADRVAVMYLGHIVEIADSDDLFREPRHPYTRTLLSAVPSLESRRPPRRLARADDSTDPNGSEFGCPFFPRCPHPDRDETCRSSFPRLEPRSGRGKAACHKA